MFIYIYIYIQSSLAERVNSLPPLRAPDARCAVGASGERERLGRVQNHTLDLSAVPLHRSHLLLRRLWKGEKTKQIRVYVRNGRV